MTTTDVDHCEKFGFYSAGHREATTCLKLGSDVIWFILEKTLVAV